MTELKLTQILKNQLNQLRLLANEIFQIDSLSFNEDELIDLASTNKRCIIGRILPQSNIFENRIVQIEIQLPLIYPLDPPRVRFLTSIYHPNVAWESGEFRHGLLSKSIKWKADKTLVDIIKTIVNSIDHPDIDYPINSEATEEFLRNHSEYNRKALQRT